MMGIDPILNALHHISPNHDKEWENITSSQTVHYEI